MNRPREGGRSGRKALCSRGDKPILPFWRAGGTRGVTVTSLENHSRPPAGKTEKKKKIGKKDLSGWDQRRGRGHLRDP